MLPALTFKRVRYLFEILFDLPRFFFKYPSKPEISLVYLDNLKNILIFYCMVPWIAYDSPYFSGQIVLDIPFSVVKTQLFLISFVVYFKSCIYSQNFKKKSVVGFTLLDPRQPDLSKTEIFT